MKKKRYSICGVSNRGMYQYVLPMLKEYKRCAELVALLDIDPMRFEVCKELAPETASLPCYLPKDFDKMIAETRPDVLIVAGMDCTHVDYIVGGLKHDLDIISEKPMTTNTADALRVLAAESHSKGKVVCTFNYRYNPIHMKVREMVISGKVGRVTHVDLTWYIDIEHGASYFNRWNRMRENSGGLSIHKASHHFDLVNWWIDGIPEYVHAFGALNHYGPDGEFNPSRQNGRHCNECPEFFDCAYKTRWATRNSAEVPPEDHMSSYLAKVKRFTSYRPDMCIFDQEIDIHDTYVVNVKYRNGALLNYSANFSTPYEGYRLAINGTRGRLETMQYGGAGGCPLPDLNEGMQFIDYFPIFEGRERIHVPETDGGHGGGDPLIREDIFLGENPKRKFDILAYSVDGLRAIAIGDAVWDSIKSHRAQDLTGYIR